MLYTMQCNTMCDVLCGSAMQRFSMGHARCAKRCVLCEAHRVLPVHENIHAAANQSRFPSQGRCKGVETVSCIYAVSEDFHFSTLENFK